MRPLPPKQNGIFKKILKCYDYKQYKMGLKLTKQILSNPDTANHGETLAMKGLILNCMGKKEEAYEYVRKGLRNDLTSHVCWHVYGLLQRSEHKYDEAIKCYRNALKYEKDNITILRDLSLLQIQMRDLEGFRDTRYQLFMLRSAQRVSWLSFAVAYHLLKDYATAAKILDEFRRTQKQQNSSGNNNQSSASHQPLPPPPSSTAGLDSNQAIDNNSKNADKDYKKTNEPIDYEQSELLLYQIMILYEAANYKEALDFLNKHSSQICDRQSLLEYKADLLLALNRNAEAVKFINENLIARNQENRHYYQLLEKALNLNIKDEINRLHLYQNIQTKYPRAQLPFKIPLTFVDSPERFTPLVDAYLRKCIRKCLPALFRNLKPVYDNEYHKMVQKINEEYADKQQTADQSDTRDLCNSMELLYIGTQTNSIDARKARATVFATRQIPSKIKIIEDLALSYIANLQENISFDKDPGTKNSENKTSILWVYYYLAQHYDYMGHYEKALDYVRLAIEHTPTLIELLTLKGKIYKHLGDVEKAVEEVNEAQKLDTADRYLNSKCAKYLLRANKVQQAEDMFSKFTRAGVTVTENLNEMQCMWFQIETANAYHRMEKYGLALKKCYELDSYFNEVTEDQFDFHTYCMRKMTLRSYIKLLRMEDVLRSHKFYFEAAKLAINIYLKLYDEPLKEGKENRTNSNSTNQLSAAELKKIKNKERKAAAKQQQNQKHGNSKSTNQDGDHEHGKNKTNKNDPQQQSNSNKQSQANDAEKEENDSTGMDPSVLEHPKDPLEKAIRFLTPLKLLATGTIETYLLAFEVYRRKNKVLLMLQSVKRAQKLDRFNQKLRLQMNQFLDIVSSMTKEGKLSEPIRKVLDLELPKLSLNASVINNCQ